MARSMTPAQFRSHLQQQASRQRQAINRYNQEVQNHNRKVKTAIDNYNREVRAYLSASYLAAARGTNSHDVHVFTVTLGRQFEIGSGR